MKKFPYDERVQDRYSYRGIPQVHGVVIEAIDKLRKVIEDEINSATDNPLFDFIEKGNNDYENKLNEFRKSKGDIIFNRIKNEDTIVRAYSGANSHGQPLATVINYLKIAITSLGLISDKRSFSILDERLSYGLPTDLAYDTKNADGGLMLVQYAGAARAAENRVLSTPSSVMSISTAANQEDFVSMGANGAIHLRKIIENTEKLSPLNCCARSEEFN